MKNHVATLALLGLVATFGTVNSAQASTRGNGIGCMGHRERAYVTDRALRSDAKSVRDQRDIRGDEYMCCGVRERATEADKERVAERGDDGRQVEVAAGRDIFSRRDSRVRREKEKQMRSRPNDQRTREVLTT